MINLNKIYTSKNHGNFKIINYINSTSVTIEFIKTGYTITTQASHITRGLVKDKLFPIICGIGYIGIGDQNPSFNRKMTKQYKVWRGMIQRCYDPRTHKRQPTYKDCFVVDEWHDFQTFSIWFNKNYINGYELDKDLLTQGNKCYSPEFCVFVSKAVNTLTLDNKASRGQWPVGVHYDKDKDKFRASCCVKGKGTHIGYYQTPDEAHEAYKEFKYSLIRSVADIQPEPIRSALLNYIIK